MHEVNEQGQAKVGGRVLSQDLVQSSVDELDMSPLAEELVAAAGARGIALTGGEGLLTALTRPILQSALEVELAEHLG